jgi:signal transduction histidine kinase
LIASRVDEAWNIVFTVRDSGTGISEDIARQLFEPFFSTKPRGMGLGLSICRSIIDAHGGQIRAFNNEGHGATFQCTLPPLGSHRDVNRFKRGEGLNSLE